MMAWDVPNPKGRVASILAVILWSVLIALLAVRGDWSTGPVLLLFMFCLLLALSLLRLYQEWRENGEWLE